MEKYNAFRSFVFTVTTATVFFLWSIIQPVIITLHGVSNLISIVLGAVISLGSYKIILKLTEKFIMKITCIKILMFGRSYLDGVWVGSYISMENEPRFYIEYFEQDFDNLIIRSKCFKEDFSYKGNWISTEVSINVVNGELSYTYETNMQENKFKNIGFATFYFERASKDKYPTKLHGFSSDLYSGQKIPSVELRVKNPQNFNEKELLTLAKDVYEDHKDTILKIN